MERIGTRGKTESLLIDKDLRYYIIVVDGRTQ